MKTPTTLKKFFEFEIGAFAENEINTIVVILELI